MNLELLDPFRRQIPDRIDATITMPVYLHSYRMKGEDNNSQPQLHHQVHDEDWKAAYHVSYNRRGTYMAVGYGSGTVGVHDVLSRTLSAVYRADMEDAESSEVVGTSSSGVSHRQEEGIQNGVTSVSWSRRSRTLLAGAVGDSLVRLYDTTHPYGAEECITNLAVNDTTKDADKDQDDDNKEHKPNPRISPSNASPISTPDQLGVKQSTFSDAELWCIEFARQPRTIPIENLSYMSRPGDRSSTPIVSRTKTIIRYPALYFDLPDSIAGSLEIHPRITTGGMAVLTNGSLVLFWVPESAWWLDEHDTNDDVPAAEHDHKSAKSGACVWNLWNETASSIITSACFDPQGQRIYATTKEGMLLGFEVGSVFSALTSKTPAEIPPAEQQCHFTIRIAGGATVWHILTSRDGKYIVVNCADGALRLYMTKYCWQTPEEVDRPAQVFHDVVNKVKFVSCAISGDGEYVVGGANGVSDDKYELYIWNTSSGALMDKLTGAAVQLYSVAWHPTRSFLAVGTSDGLVDIWGPRINWTAFAPDFQALPRNVEYIEREDEFDLDKDGNKLEPIGEKDTDSDDETAAVDVVGVEPVPVFASDSEEEEEVFYFETKFTNILGGRGKYTTSLPGRED